MNTSARRVAAIDCGTNSIRLLIADVSEGRLTDIERQMRVVRLGQGVDATGEFAADALERTFAATDEYATLIRQHGAERIRFVATSASRDVRNRAAFVDGIRERLGVEPDVIPGEEEAALSFAGAASVLSSTSVLSDSDSAVAGSASNGSAGPTLVVDLGGGSTEFVVGELAGPAQSSPRVLGAVSVPLGCVRFTERYLHSDPPSSQEIAAAQVQARQIIDTVAQQVPLASVRQLVGVAGTVTTITAHALGLPSYQPESIHGATVSVSGVERAAGELLAMNRAQRAELPFMHPGRVDVIGAGALLWSIIVDEVAQRTGGRVTTVTSSEHDILDGIALAIG
ncbi:Ppx/GppA phosphatase family protein [Psychromicrobium xiongbiense]|uniref:Ppx/GppA phosphatase family protein n=1 Tax=Psychromicrobium xiongbiense TaxID=3051184 RepID=UPI0025521A7A|nr:Ppx/GppA phosphatase family protein [Psychromicrobium sp. YIM S02556]